MKHIVSFSGGLGSAEALKQATLTELKAAAAAGWSRAEDRSKSMAEEWGYLPEVDTEITAGRQAFEEIMQRLERVEAENKVLREALEQIASKSDPERPKKWDAEMDTSFGITLGWWSAGVIARKALEAAALAQATKPGEA